MTNHELAILTANAIESDELATALFDKFDREHNLNSKEWKILDKILDEIYPISDEDLSFMMEYNLIDED